MDSPQDTSLSAPQSPQSDGSTYGTPTNESATVKVSEKDAQLVVGAGRSLKNMLVDLMGVLERQANTKIFIQGDITLRVDGRESYVINLRNEDNIEPSNLKVRIDNAPAQVYSAATASTAEKRKADDLEKDTTNGAESASKRARTDDSPTIEDNEDDKPEEQDRSDFGRIMTKFHNVSAQIKWVEECRRVAGQAHDAREEKWRATSATFHDDNRKSREQHETWLVSEIGWQRNMLIQLANDVKGLYPLTHSLKWETPPQLSHSPAPLPMPAVRDKPLGKACVPKLKKIAASANAPKK
jgi:hypothetical protein